MRGLPKSTRRYDKSSQTGASACLETACCGFWEDGGGGQTLALSARLGLLLACYLHNSATYCCRLVSYHVCEGCVLLHVVCYIV